MEEIIKITTPKLPNYVYDVEDDIHKKIEKEYVDEDDLISWANKLPNMLDTDLSCMNYKIGVMRRDMATKDDIKRIEKLINEK